MTSLLLLCGVQFMVVLDITVVNVALVILKRRPSEPRGQFEVPVIVPALAAVVCVGMIVNGARKMVLAYMTASARGARNGTMRPPVRSWSTISRVPPAGVATTGTPAMRASRTAFGSPSTRLGCATTSKCGRSRATSWRGPRT